MIAAQPCGKVVELVAIRQDRREADDPPLLRVRAAKEPLDLHLVANLTLVGADHMPFVEDQQADIIEKRRIIAQREVELLGRRDDDVSLADRVLVEAADANTAIEGRDGLAERAEGPLQHGFGLRRQRAQRGDEDNPLASRQAA